MKEERIRALALECMQDDRDELTLVEEAIRAACRETAGRCAEIADREWDANQVARKIRSEFGLPEGGE